MKDALDSTEEFFNLPSEEKMCFASSDVHKPEQYVLPPSQRPNPSLVDYISTNLPVIDLSMMNHPTHRSQLIDKVHAASVMKEALDSAEEFLKLPSDEKMSFASADVHKHDDIKEGSQVMAVNCYPSCPEPDRALGMPPHTDYGTLTILNQSHQGLEIMDHDKIWHPVPFIKDALIVQLGDQFEVISNGRYKSVPHKVTLNVQRMRFSIASLHSMQLEKKVGPAPELVDDQHPVAYALSTDSFHTFRPSYDNCCRSLPP